jgi:hypothetical protein
VADKQIDPDQLSRIVMLTYGNMDHGGPYWCYVAIKPTRYDDFQAAMISKKYNMQDFDKDGFGEVIVSGEGAMPPQDVTRQVADMFKVPVKKLFQETDPKRVIFAKIEELKGA